MAEKGTTLKLNADVRNMEAHKRVSWIMQQFNKYEQYWRKDMARARANARMYWHVNFGQWPRYVVDKLRSQGRRPPTFPVIPDKIETLVGSFIANDFDFKVEPMTGKIDKLTLKAQDMLYADKNNLDWEMSEIPCVLDSHIYKGCERMVISDEVDEFGNIAWEHLNSRHVYESPTWKTHKVDDLHDYMIWDDLLPSEIMRKYSKSSDRLKEAYRREQVDGADYGDHWGAVPRYRTLEEKWGSYKRVVELHWVEATEKWWEYDKVNRCFFPETGLKKGSDEDHQAKMKYVQMMGLTPDDITFLKKKDKIKYVQAICPELDRELFLANGKDIIQTGNVNLYLLGIRYNGQFASICDRMYDVQTALNKGEMNIQDVQARMAKGAFIMDRALSGGDPELEQQIEQAWNDPGARIWVDEGATERLAKGGVIELPSKTPTQDMFAQPARMADYADRFSKVSAAQDSRTESGKESGRLFRYKLEVGMVGQKYLMKFWEYHKKWKTEAYFRQAKITYAGFPRKFVKQAGREIIEINTRMRDEYSGQEFVVDDISTLPLMKVTLVPKKTGINIRNDLRSRYAEYLDGLQAPEDRLLKLIIYQHILETEDLDDQGKAEMMKALHLLKMQAAGMVGVSIQQMMGQMGRQQQIAQEQGGAMPTMPPSEEESAPPQISQGAMSEQEAMAGTTMQPINP